MPVLKNARHEMFANGLADGLDATNAYIKAGYRPHRQAASRLLTKVDVKARVKELTREVTKRAIKVTAIDKAWVMRELEANYRAATEAEQHSAATGALKLLGVEIGLFTERSKIEHAVNYVIGASMEGDEATPSDWAGKFQDISQIDPKSTNGHH